MKVTRPDSNDVRSIETPTRDIPIGTVFDADDPNVDFPLLRTYDGCVSLLTPADTYPNEYVWTNVRKLNVELRVLGPATE